uniref:EGF-like domain-containing protein n=1 Tax=Ciona intestinalis TaxID=7719 RepID=F6ZFF2_CIOIN
MKVAFVVLSLLVIGAYCQSTSPRPSNCVRKVWRGCNVRTNGKCACKKKSACINPFVYRTKRTCRRLNRNICRTHPCQNHGYCQPMQGRQFKCQCFGTGFYGKNCETACPERNPHDSQLWKFPQECISV